MPTNSIQRVMRLKLRRLVASGMEFFRAAREAGYAPSTIKKKGAQLKRVAGLAVPEKPRQGLVWVQEWSPVSGKTFTSSPPAVEAKPTTPTPVAEDFAARKQRELEAVMDRLARKQAAERSTSFAMSYITKRMHLDGTIH